MNTDAMNVEQIDVAQLVPDPNNARTHPDVNMKAIESSLARFGQRVPLVVQRRNDELVVRAGNARLEAAKKLGWNKVNCIVFDEDDTQATAYAIADNQTAITAAWDYDLLRASLEALDAENFDVEALGFDSDLSDIMDGIEVGPPRAVAPSSNRANLQHTFYVTCAPDDASAVHEKLIGLRDTDGVPAFEVRGLEAT